MRYQTSFRAVLPDACYQHFQGIVHGGIYMPGSRESQQPKLLDQAREVLRLHHYSIHTERAYLEWIVRYLRFHSINSLIGGGCLLDIAFLPSRAIATAV